MWFTTLILKNLLRRRVRSLLTCLGVAIAVGTMIALLGIAEDFERSSVASFEQRGVDIVIVEDGVPDQLSSNLDEKIEARLAGIPGVKAVGPGLLEIVAITRGRSTLNVLVQGWRPTSFLLENLQIESGRKLTDGDHRAILLGTTLARALGKKIGDDFELQGEPFRIIGIYKSVNVFEDGAVVVAISDLQEVMARKGRVTGFSLLLETSGNDALIDATCARIIALTDERGKPLRLSVMPTREYVSTSLHIRLAHAMAWMTSAIAIFIGTVSMLNTMVMLVAERTREIGILRAMGWKQSRIVRMILGESIALSLAGSLVGCVAAIILTQSLTRVPMVAGYISGNIAPMVFVKALLMAVAVGILGGIYPAIRAARLVPTEAIRHE